MTLIYRAVWDDDWCLPLPVLEDEFKSWCASKRIEVDDIPYRGRLVVSEDLWIEVLRADAEMGQALRCILSETDQRGRTWTTTATALSDADVRSFWVDLECHDPVGGQPEMAAPRLVRGLIQNGGNPTSYGVPLRAECRPLGPATVDGLVSAVLDPDRLVPLVVFSPDPRSADPLTTINRANAAAETLAGLAHVYVVTPDAIPMLNAALPDGFGVYGGAVRMYLPALQADDPDDAHRHRWIPLRLIAAHPRRAAAILAERLARLQLHPPIPTAWNRLGGLLHRPTETEVVARASEIASSRAPDEPRTDQPSLQAEIDDLTKLLAEADLFREAVEEQARQDVASLQSQVAAAEVARYDDADELEELRRELDAKQGMIRALVQPSVPVPADRTDPRDLEIPTSIGEAIELGGEHLEFVVIPDEALRDIDELDATPKYQVWGSSIWQGLLALNRYAESKSEGEQPPGFKLWCEQTGAWPSSKLSMTESETVLNNDQLRNQRLFPVAGAVESSGRVHMFSHLKIQAGGSDNIPRLYFCDDSDGESGQMHVGFIGPHRHVRNTKS